MLAERVVERFLTARTSLMWPRLRGNLMELTENEELASSVRPGAEIENFRRGDVFELTGKVMRAVGASSYLLEGFMDSPSDKFWVPITLRHFGPVPHKLTTPKGEELGPDFFKP